MIASVFSCRSPMKYNMLKWFWVCFFLVALALPFSRAEEKDEGKIIRKVEVIGLERHAQSEIATHIQSAENAPFSYKTFQEDIQRLNDTGIFSSINWEIMPMDDGVKIIIYVKENEIVENIYYDGFAHVNVKTLVNDLKLKTDGPFNEYYLLSDKKLLEEEYRKKGYHFAEVTVKKSKGLRGVLIIYSVREGPAVRVNRITITGNKSFPKRRVLLIFPKHPIMGKMRTKESHWYGSHYFVESEVFVDLSLIENFYRDEGWLDAAAFVGDMVFTEKKDRVNININIVEGARYFIRKIDVVGNASIPTGELLKDLTMKEGSAYRMEEVVRAIKVMRRRYGKLGMIDCMIEPRMHYPQEGTLDLTFHIDECGKKYLGKLNITGNHKTKDKVIRREFTIHPGELLDYEKVEASLDRVGATMFFQQVKPPEFDDGYGENVKDMNLEIEEGPTGSLNIGGGFSSNSGFGGMLSITQNNFDIARTPESVGQFFTGGSFAGGGQRFAITLRPGVKLTQFSIQFVEPYLFDKPLMLGANYSIWDRNWIDYSETRSTTGLSLDRRFKGGLIIGCDMNFQYIDISQVDDDASSIIQDLEGTDRANAIIPAITFDRRNFRLLPTKGYRLHLENSFTGGFMGGDFDFMKTVFRAESYFPIIEEQNKLICNMIFRLGRVVNTSDTEEVPFYEKFYAGGTDTVRGFDYRTISPKDPGDNDLSIGGLVYNVVNLEVTYPLYRGDETTKPFEIPRFVMFVDAGNVADKIQDLTADTYRVSWGFGFRMYLGGSVPINLFAGFPLKMEDGDDRDTIQFDIGFMY